MISCLILSAALLASFLAGIVFNEWQRTKAAAELKLLDELKRYEVVDFQHWGS